ncbi:MAG: hypothetical protein V4494_08110 [Chlamydiota bacterium]
MSDIILVGQKQWAFTSSDSNTPKVQTSSFGPCYGVSFIHGKYAALAHIDDTTQINSITSIFDRFAEYSIEPKNIKVTIVGGWKEHPESFKWGIFIIQKLQSLGVETISKSIMFRKTIMHDISQTFSQGPQPFFEGGMYVDATLGKTYVLKDPDATIERRITESPEFQLIAQQNSSGLEYPLSEVRQ